MTTTPTPALFAGRKKPTSPPKSDSSEPSSEAKAKIERGEGKPKRVPRLLVNHPELEEIMTRLKADEEINRKHGWYDRNRNGRQHNKRKTHKEKN